MKRIIILLLIACTLSADIPNKFHGYAIFGNVGSDYLYVGGERFKVDSTSNKGGVITVRFNNRRDSAVFREDGDDIHVVLNFSNRTYYFTY